MLPVGRPNTNGLCMRKVNMHRKKGLAGGTKELICSGNVEGWWGAVHFCGGSKVVDPFDDVARHPFGDARAVWTNYEAHEAGL